MASYLLVSDHLLRCSSHTSDLVSTPLGFEAYYQPTSRDATLARWRWVDSPAYAQLYSPGLSTKAKRKEAGGEGGKATDPGRSASKITCKLFNVNVCGSADW